MKQKRPDVFTYHDCKLFLNEMCSHLKLTSPGFNIQSLSRDAKVSKSYLSMVLSGERKITDVALRKIMPFLQLTPGEQTYLLLLRDMSSSTSQSEKVKLIEEMQKLRSYQKNNPEEAAVFRYLSRWYHAAIREMAALPDFQLNASWIQERLQEPVPLADIEKGIEFLLQAGFLQQDAAGKVHPPDRRLECHDQVLRAAMLKYHEQVFSLAIEHIPTLPMDRKFLNAHLTAISLESFAKIKSLLEETLEKIVEIAEQDQKPEMIFQFSMLAFALSKMEEKKGEGET